MSSAVSRLRSRNATTASPMSKPSAQPTAASRTGEGLTGAPGFAAAWTTSIVCWRASLASSAWPAVEIRLAYLAARACRCASRFCRVSSVEVEDRARQLARRRRRSAPARRPPARAARPLGSHSVARSRCGVARDTRRRRLEWPVAQTPRFELLGRQRIVSLIADPNTACETTERAASVPSRRVTSAHTRGDCAYNTWLSTSRTGSTSAVRCRSANGRGVRIDDPDNRGRGVHAGAATSPARRQRRRRRRRPGERSSRWRRPAACIARCRLVRLTA